ncbi:MAG: site-specific integrase [Acidobacteria bacterium]|nr:site-specific integrase [Acidobacteriota bacterium]
MSAKTVKHIHACLRCGLNDAMKFGLIHRNVAALVSPPKIVKKEIQVLTVEQADKFLESIEDNRLAALYWTAIYLGLRRGELLGLRWQDIDFESKILRVSGSLQELDGKLTLTETKTETSRRSLPIPDMVLAKLKAHRSKQLEKKLKRGSLWQETGLAFVTGYGTPISPRNLVRDFHAALEAVEIPRMPFHALRHSCATFLLSKGMPMRFIMNILGHSQISLTANTYSHVTPEMLGDTLDIMNSILAKRQ